MGQRRPSLDLDALLTSLYRVAESPRRWMDEVVARAADRVNLGAGVGGVLYDVTDEDSARGAYVKSCGSDEEWARAGAAMHQEPQMMPSIVTAYRSIIAGDSLQVTAHAKMSSIARSAYLDSMRSFGVRDEWLINGRGAGGTGAALYLFSPTSIAWTARQRPRMQGLADHVGTALRVQQTMAEVGILRHAHAILDRRGNVQHLSNKLQGSKRLRASLGEPARSNAAARLAHKHWGREWRFLDYFDRDGKEFVILCRTELQPAARALSRRERQIVTQVVLGASEKEIAFDLGIAGSTVRVLLARAASKLGAKNRSELIARWNHERAANA